MQRILHISSHHLHVSDRLGGWISQASGDLNPALLPLAVLHTRYARACDPVLGFLKAAERYTKVHMAGGWDGAEHLL